MNIQLPGAEFYENMSTHKMFCLNTGLCRLKFCLFEVPTTQFVFEKLLFLLNITEKRIFLPQI